MKRTLYTLNIISITALSCLIICGGVADAESFEQIEARYNGPWSYPDNLLASNIYVQVRSVYAYDTWQTLYDYFYAVRGGGVRLDLEDRDMPKFLALTVCVSNHCAEIAADWRTYETNEVVRFTTLSAVGYSGYSNFTNFADIVTTQILSNPSLCSSCTMNFLVSPYGTPSETCMGLNYDNPVVSNIITRIRQVEVSLNQTNGVNACDAFLSGEWKREYLEMKAAGAL